MTIFLLITGLSLIAISFWPKAKKAVGLSGGECNCSVGSSFNMSCEDTCQPSGGHIACLATDAGCGFMWMYSCNGKCRTE